MGKPKLLIITTAYHHRHRYRLHNFLPYLTKYFKVNVIDISALGYDRSYNESLYKLLSRIVKEMLKTRVKVENYRDIYIYTLRSLLPGDFGPLTALPLLDILMRKVSCKGYSAVLATPFLAGVIALQLRDHIRDVPIIYEDVDRFFDFFKNPLKRLIVKTLEYQAIERCDHVIAASPHLYLEDSHIRRNKPTHLIPNGIDYKLFRHSASRIRRRDRYAIVYVGAVEWWSGLDIAIRALSLATREIHEIKLYVIGDYTTPYGIHLADLIKHLGLERKVVFLGRRPYDFVVRFLPRCRVGLLTFPRSKVTEGAFPYKVLEYCAAGLPVVMTNVTVLAKLVEMYNAGRVHDVNDVEGIASSIVELVSNDNIWREYSANAVKLASLFDVARLARQEAEIILSAGSR